MATTSILTSELSSSSIDINCIYLDPNNPRFVTKNWNDVSVDHISDESTQELARKVLIADFSVNQLIENIRVNGYLPIDRVIVKEIGDNKYVVLEGNRRICAVKEILRACEKNTDYVSPEIKESMSSIECLIYSGSEEQPAWIFQGLRHIIGIQEWPAFNKARLLVQLMESQDLSLTEVGKKFGLSAYGAGQWVRGYYAFKQAAEESDYSQEVDEKAYPYLQEIFGRSNVAFKDWLKWNEQTYKFDDISRFTEFLGWLYPRDEENVCDGVTVLGNWDNRYIKRSNDLRIVSSLLRDSIQEFEQFRADGDLEKAQNTANMRLFLNSQDPSSDTLEKIKNCTKALENIPYKLVKNQNELLHTLLSELKVKIDEIIEQ